MAERIHVSHYHSTGGTKPQAANLYDGELALGIKAGEEKIFLKNTSNEIAEFIDKDAIERLIDERQFLTGETYNGTVKEVAAGNGLTGGGSANVGATAVTLNVGEGTGITVSADAVSISSDYQEKIGKGEEALTKINTFLADAAMTGSAIDTLVELQTYINADSGATAEMMANIDEALKYKGTITGVTAGEGLAGGGSSSTGATGITISHAEKFNNSGTTESNTTSNGVTLAYGGSLNIPSIDYDKFGHITGVSSIEIKLPESDNTDYSGTTETLHYTPTTAVSGKAINAGNGKYISGIALDSKNHIISATTGTLPTFTEQFKGTVTSVKVEGANGLTGSGTITSAGTITISHATATTATTTTATTLTHGGTFTVPTITRDAYGHITGVTGTTYTLPTDNDTHHTAKNVVTSTNSGKTDGTATNGNVWLNLIENNEVRSNHNIKGSGTILVTASTSGDITIYDTTVERNDSEQTAESFGTTGQFTAITGVATDDYGRVSGVTTTTYNITSISCGTF